MKSLLHLMLCCLSWSCLASEFRICADNRGIPPYLYVDGMGSAQYLAIQAAKNLHLTLKLDYHPQPRCMQGLAQGHYDALLVGSPSPAMNEIAVFPQDAQGRADTSLAYGHYRLVAFKLKTSPLRWDGQHFSPLDKPVLYQGGVPMVQLVMDRLNLPQQASARTPLNLIEMIRLGRADVGVVMEPLLRHELQQHDPQGLFEIIEPALLEADAYMGMSKQLIARNPQLARQVWEEIRRLRTLPEWPRIRAATENNQLPPAQIPTTGAQPAAQTP